MILYAGSVDEWSGPTAAPLPTSADSRTAQVLEWTGRSGLPSERVDFGSAGYGAVRGAKRRLTLPLEPLGTNCSDLCSLLEAMGQADMVTRNA